MMSGKNAKDVFWLTSIRATTVILGFIGTRLLSDSFSYEEYGTYSQLNMLIDILTSLSILGMTDGVNFYFSKARENGEYEYVNSIFGLQLIIGMFDAIVFLLLSGNLAHLMNNPSLQKYIIWIAFRPLLVNYIAMLSVINIAVGNARIIAIRNGCFSIFKLLGIIAGIKMGNNLVIILMIFLIFDFVSLFMYIYKYKECGMIFRISFLPKIWKDIIKFCIPIGAYVLVNGLFRNADKFIVSIFSTAYEVSVYANGSAQLPFDIVWTSVQTIMIPIITYNITTKKYADAFFDYCVCMKINAIFTVLLVVSALIVAPELVEFLYGTKYKASVVIFRIYLVTELFKYLGISVIITSNGQGKYLLKVSTIMLIINGVLDVLLFRVFGLPGPAISTVFVMAIMMFVFLRKSMRILGRSFYDFIKQINLYKYLTISFIVSTFVYICKKGLIFIGLNNFFSAVIVCVLYIVLILAINRKIIAETIKDFNRMK